MERAAEGALPVKDLEPVGRSVAAMRLRRFLRDRVGVGSAIFFLVIVIAGILAPVIAPYDLLEVDFQRILEPPSPRHLMGTDYMGRDIFSRVLYGARITLASAGMVMVMVLLIGTVVGGASAYLGGRADQILMRITDIFLAFPSLILALALAAALGPSTTNATIALGLSWWPSTARLVRGQVLAAKKATYVEAARSYGASGLRLLIRHILPNCMDPVFARITLFMGYVILNFAALSFIGAGAQSPSPEWGLLIAGARHYLYSAGYYPTLIGLVIFATVLSVTLAANAIQDAFDPSVRDRVAE